MYSHLLRCTSVSIFPSIVLLSTCEKNKCLFAKVCKRNHYSVEKVVMLLWRLVKETFPHIKEKIMS